ncbi:MAG: NADH-quinone oxidoreductase subunit N [Acidobacteriota bacterium]
MRGGRGDLMTLSVSEIIRGMHWIKPEILLSFFGFVMLILTALFPRDWRKGIGFLSLISILIVLILIPTYIGFKGKEDGKVISGEAQGAFPDIHGRPGFVVDGFSVFFKIVILLSSALAILLSFKYLDYERIQEGEYYALIIFAAVGMMFMASALDFALIYVGLELMALSVYILVGFIKWNRKSNEAALKYFLLGAFSSGILLYGISLVYGVCGTTNLNGIRIAIENGVENYLILETGMIFILVGMAFKIAAVPFHMWTPDAYEGAPTSITAFISTGPKAAAFAILLRVFIEGFVHLQEDWTLLFALIAFASMTLGNITAISQDNVKRMLAYSSIAHAGYALMGVVAFGAAFGDWETKKFGLISVILYTLIYTFMNIGAFGFVVLLRRTQQVGDRLEDFSGLARRNGLAAFVMLIFMLSLAGIPSTAGFIGKWWLFGAAIKANYTWLAIAAVINSAISLYYYMRVVVTMYMGQPREEEKFVFPPGVTSALAISVFFIFLIGLYPGPFIDFARFALLPIAFR